MPNWLLDGLADVGYALDTPGAYARGLLAGRPGERASGEDLLSSYGVDAGPLGGFAAEMVVDPLTLLPPVYGAYRGARALAGAGDMAPLMRRLDDLTPAPRTLDTRLGELGAQVDPMDRLRHGYRGSVGAGNPIGDALGEFAGDESGALDMDGLARMFGGDYRAANVAAVQGPNYPGGADKLADMLRGNVPEGVGQDLLGDPLAAKYMASEIPEGSSFLGRGAHGVAFATPMDSVVRVSRRQGELPLKRLEIPEMLQPFRSVYKGGHTVEHLPRVRPLDGLVDEDLRLDDVEALMRREGMDASVLNPLFDDRLVAQDAAYTAQRRALSDLAKRGFEDHDWDYKNVGLTPEGRLLSHDPGTLFPNFAAARDTPRSSVFLTDEGTPFRNAVRGRSASVGAPDYIREALQRDAAIGAAGQGVVAPDLDAAGPAMERLGAFLSQMPPDLRGGRDRVEEVLRRLAGQGVTSGVR